MITTMLLAGRDDAGADTNPAERSAGMSVDLVPDALRAAFGTFPSGVVAVCGTVDGAPAGIAASTFFPVSLDPPLVGLCIQRTSRTWPLLRTAPALGLSVLSSDHQLAARQLAARAGDRFAGLATTTDASGAIYIDTCPTWLSCTLEDETDGGDHVIALLRVRSVRCDPQVEPLVFHRSEFVRLSSGPRDHTLAP